MYFILSGILVYFVLCMLGAALEILPWILYGLGAIFVLLIIFFFYEETHKCTKELKEERVRSKQIPIPVVDNKLEQEEACLEYDLKMMEQLEKELGMGGSSSHISYLEDEIKNLRESIDREQKNVKLMKEANQKKRYVNVQFFDGGKKYVFKCPDESIKEDDFAELWIGCPVFLENIRRVYVRIDSVFTSDENKYYSCDILTDLVSDDKLTEAKQKFYLDCKKFRLEPNKFAYVSFDEEDLSRYDHDFLIDDMFITTNDKIVAPTLDGNKNCRVKYTYYEYLEKLHYPKKYKKAIKKYWVK